MTPQQLGKPALAERHDLDLTRIREARIYIEEDGETYLYLHAEWANTSAGPLCFHLSQRSVGLRLARLLAPTPDTPAA